MSQFAAIRFVFLDRDGVINREPPEGGYITRPEDLELLPGSAHAVKQLNESGRKVILVTNQRGIALGLMTQHDLEDIHEHLRTELARSGAVLDAIYYCPHDRTGCGCRKPRIGMIRSAFRDYPGANPDNSILIGNSPSDVACGRNAGMRTILIDNDPDRRKVDLGIGALTAQAVAPSLKDAVTLLF